MPRGLHTLGAPFAFPYAAPSTHRRPPVRRRKQVVLVRARYYDPTLGRLIAEDPIGLAGGVNQYAYAGNDPVNGRDPSGLEPCEWVVYHPAINEHSNETFTQIDIDCSGHTGQSANFGNPNTRGGPTIGPATGIPSYPGPTSDPIVQGAKVVGRKVLAGAEELGDFALAATGTASFHAAASLGASLGKQWLAANMKLIVGQGINRAVENRALNYGGHAALEFASAVGGLGGTATLGYVDASAALRGGVLNADFVLGALPYVGAAYTGWKAAKCLYNQ